MELIKIADNEKLFFTGKVLGIIGQFDGMHLGHLKLINEGKQKAQELNLKTALITFSPHPDYVLGKREDNGYITPFSEKQQLVTSLNLDFMVVINFTLSLSHLSPLAFYKQFLSSLTWIYVGSDYHYGYKGEGNIESLQKIHKNVVGVEILKHHDHKISSNDIRFLITEGRVDEIYAYMQRYYNITGQVKHGDKIGRTLGIRTANLDLDGEYQIIKKGVYAVLVTIDKQKYLGVCNIGHNPTLNFTKQQRLEVHVIDFSGDLYTKTIAVDFLKYLRAEINYFNKEDLIMQINQDIKDTLSLFGDLL